MVDTIQIPNLPAATSLDGTEQLEIVQGGVSRRTTTGQIAEFAAAGSGGFISSSTELVDALNANQVAYLSPGADITISTDNTFTAKNIKIIGNNSIVRFTGIGKFSFSNCIDPIIEGVNFIGSITSSEQYETIAGSMTPYFQSVTYSDGTSTISGADFDHVLVGDSLSITLPVGLAGTLAERYVVSSSITLDPNSRYIVDIDKGCLTGDGSTNPRFEKFDGGGSSLGFYVPQSSSTYYSVITGASSLKIYLGGKRVFHTATGLQVTWNLTKFKVYKLINEMASVTIASPVGDGSPIFFFACTRPIIRYCTFTRHPRSAYTSLNCIDELIQYNTVRECFGGLATNTGTRPKFIDNLVDLSWLVAGSSTRVGQRFLRTRCVNGVACDEALVANNVLIGSSWGVEIILNDDTKYAVVMQNRITAEYTGISLVAGGASAKSPLMVINNVITLSPSASMGIEAAVGASTSCTSVIQGNRVETEDVLGGVGVAVSGSASLAANVQVVNNDITCSVCISSSSNSGTMRVRGNQLNFGQLGVVTRAYYNVIDSNTTNLVRNCFSFANDPQASVYIDVPVYFLDHEVTNNRFQTTATYLCRINNVSRLIYENNVATAPLQVYTGRLFEVYVTVTVESFASLIYLRNNSLTYSTLGAQFSVENSLFTGSQLLIEGNRFNGLMTNIVSGTQATLPTSYTGTGSPEGVYTAVIGSTFTRTNGGAGTTFYLKETGTGNTGWIGK